MTEHDDGEQGPDTDGLAKAELPMPRPGSPAARAAQLAYSMPEKLIPPPEMEGCTIRFVECDFGHGRLTADNWVDEGCPHCRIATLEARIARKEAANEVLVQRVLAQDAKLEATMADMRSLQARNATLEEALRLTERSRAELMAEAQRLSGLLMKAAEERARPVTDSEQPAEQMRQDILGGKIDRAGRQVVRDACDKMDAPKTGRDASNDALGRISGRGGVMSGWGR